MRDVITLQNRDITPPIFGSPDFTETFTDSATVWSLIETVTGKTFFDDVDTAVNVTHHIYIRYDETVTAETWILYDGRRIDILNVESLDERNLFMLLVCNETGLASKAASEA